MSKLRAAKKRAVKEKWHKWIRSETDEQALLEGCYFDQRKADHVCEFISQYLRHGKGVWAGQAVELQSWQVDFLSRLFGWVRADGYRRYRYSSVWLPKKNGKSFLASAIGLYLLLAEGRIGAEILACANSTKQAGHVFDNACSMAKSSPELSPYIEIVPSKHIIAVPQSNSRFHVISSNANTGEGYDQTAAIFDELHAAKNDKLFNALRWGGAAQKGSLFLTISTAGVFDPEHIAYRQFAYSKSVESGEKRDTSFLPIIYAADTDDDYSSEKIWQKANPMLGVTLDRLEFKQGFEQVKDSLSDYNEWLRYRLNVWTQSVTSWIPDSKWQAAVSTDRLTEEELADRKWYAGLDLASTTDIAAFVLLSDRGEIEPHYFVSEAQVITRQKREDNSYAAWVRAGLLNQIPGEVIDYDTIFESIVKLRETHNIQAIAVDRWSATQIVQRLEGENFEVYYHGQGFRDMSNPTKELERLILSQKIKLPDCPILRWMARNVNLETDPAGNIKASKKKSKDKIDGVIALIQATTLKLLAESPESKSVYETQGVTTV